MHYFIFSVCPICCLKARKWSKRKLRSFFFNGVLTFIDGTFLLFILTGMINIRQAQNGIVPKNQSFYGAIVAVLMCTVQIIAVTIFFCKNERKQLNRKRYKQRCGYVYEELNYNVRGGWTLLYPILYQLRFMALVFAIIYISNVVIQVEIILIMTIFVIALLGNSHPLRDIK